MKRTLQVAGSELKNLFYSPIAWFVLIVFIIQSSIVFTGALGSMEQSQSLGANFSNLTDSLIAASSNGLLPAIVDKLYLYIPLLTMGLISREVSTGTIKLLYSSPLKVSEIILGKYFAIIIYCLCLLLMLALLAIVGAFIVPHWDTGLVVSGLVGVFLLLATYAAIGLFMSTLTSYQVVAAISTFVIFAVLAYIGNLWQGIDLVRDLTYFLSISGRTDKMIKGLLTSSDVLYFLIIIGMFVTFSILKLKGERESVSTWKKAGRYCLVAVVGLVLGYISARPKMTLYWDLTQLKTQTLTKNGQEIMSRLDGPFKVTTYVNLLDNSFSRGVPEQRNYDLKRWASYIRFKPDMELNYVYYYDSTADPNLYQFNPGKSIKQIADRYYKIFKVDPSLFKSPAEIRKEIDLSAEGNKYVMQLDYKGKTTFLRLYNDFFVYPSETEIMAAIKRLTDTLPKIYFATDSYTRSPFRKGDRDFEMLTSEKSFRNALINQGFDVDTLSLSRGALPRDITALVLADPQSPLSASSLKALNEYIDKGGNLVILAEPGRQAILNPVLGRLGLALTSGQLVEPDPNSSADLIQGQLTQAALGLSGMLRGSYLDQVPVYMPGATAIKVVDSSVFKNKPLVVSQADKSWLKADINGLNQPQVRFDSAVDKKGSFVLATQLTRKVAGREQKIVVSADADLMNNAELGRSNVRTANFSFNTAVFGWFTDGQFPIDSSRPRSKDNQLDITDKGVAAVKLIFIWILPALILVFGAVFLMLRKRR